MKIKIEYKKKINTGEKIIREIDLLNYYTEKYKIKKRIIKVADEKSLKTISVEDFDVISDK